MSGKRNSRRAWWFACGEMRRSKGARQLKQSPKVALDPKIPFA